MLNKRGKTVLFQISILLISIFAFAILSSEEEVSNENDILEKYCKENPTNFLCNPPQKEEVGDEVASQKDLPPPSATLPVATSSLIARKSVININGKIGVLQKNEKGVLQLIEPDTKNILMSEVKSVDLTKATADGIWAGYGTGFLGNIAQGLWWASVAVGVIQLVGGFVHDDGALTKALSGAAFGGGLFVGKGV